MKQEYTPSREELMRAFKQTPPAFAAGVECALRDLQNKEDEKVKRKIPVALVIAIAVLLITSTVVYAASNSHTIDLLKWFYGNNITLDQAEVAPVGHSVTMGPITYTLDDVIYANGVLYGSGTAVADDSAVLITEDYEVTDPAGYALHYGDEQIPEGAPTYADLARQKGCNITHVKLVPEGYCLEDKNYELQLYTGDIGYDNMADGGNDNRMTFWFEIYADPNDPTAVNMPLSDSMREEMIADGDKPDNTTKKPVDETTPIFRHIDIQDVVCNSAGRAMEFNGLPEMPMDGINLKNITIRATQEATFTNCTNIKQDNVKIVIE